MYSCDIIVCCNACFMQKWCKGPCNPSHVQPESVFVPEDVVDNVEAHVEAIHPYANNKTQRCQNDGWAEVNEDAQNMPDGYEEGMKVPMSILNDCDCESLFKAADEQRTKVSTDFFDDAGLMALLCHHDQVLWLVNMWSAGERQHYSIALLE